MTQPRLTDGTHEGRPGSRPPSKHSSNDRPDRSGPQPPNPFLTPVPCATPPAMISTVDDIQKDRYTTIDSSDENHMRVKKRSKMLVVGGIVGLLVLIAIGVGVGVGVTLSRKSGNSSSSNSNSNSSSNPNSNSSSSDGPMVAIPGTAGVVKSDPNDPSRFEKDPRLKNSFYGFAYTPLGALLPDCGATQANVTEDIQLLSQITTRIRLYGADCNQTALVLQAIKDTKVNLEVFVGIYIQDDDTAYTRQRDLIKNAIKTYGTDNIAGVTVGNEFILNSLTAVGSNDASSAAGLAAAATLIEKIQDTRAMLSEMSLSKALPVGTSDAGSYFNLPLLQAVDYGLANVHPWFADQTIENAAGWTYEFFQQTNIAQVAETTNKPSMYIAETGWPTKSSNATLQFNSAAEASVPNLQTFINTFVCASNANQTQYFFFEFKDETWKDVLYGGVEGWWGLFDANKKLKDVTIPECSHN